MSTRLLMDTSESFKRVSLSNDILQSSNQASYTALLLLKDDISTVQSISNFTTEIIEAAKTYQESNGKVTNRTISVKKKKLILSLFNIIFELNLFLITHSCIENIPNFGRDSINHKKHKYIALTKE